MRCQVLTDAWSQVVWVSLKPMFHTFNKFETAFQQGTTDGANLANPIWDKGIRGQGQVIGIADTGIDMDNCYFNQPLTSNMFCRGEKRKTDKKQAAL